MSDSSKNTLNSLMYLAFVLLFIFRIDWWWWGWKIEPLVFGWLTYPMLYQLLIWLLGWIVVVVTCKYLWPDDINE